MIHGKLFVDDVKIGWNGDIFVTNTNQASVLIALINVLQSWVGILLILCVSSRLQIKRYNSTGGFLGDFFEGLETDTLKDMYFGDCPNMFTPQIESKENDTKVWSTLLLPNCCC